MKNASSNAKLLLVIFDVLLQISLVIFVSGWKCCLWLYMMHVPLQMLSLVNFIAEIFEVQCYCY
jgi:hypothetical protein